jgi:hypothetical protein
MIFNFIPELIEDVLGWVADGHHFADLTFSVIHSSFE